MTRPVVAVPVLLAALIVPGLAPAAVQAQEATRSDRAGAALEREFPELHAVLVALEEMYAVLLSYAGRDLRAAPRQEIDRHDHGGHDTHGHGAGGETDQLPDLDPADLERYADLVDELRSTAAPGRPTHGRPSGQPLGLAGDLGEILVQTHALHRQLLSIYVDADVVNKGAAVDAAVDAYAREVRLALPLEPKSLDLVYDGPDAMAFRRAHPALNGLLWSAHWLRLAAFEPIMLLTDKSERQAGTRTVVERFWSKLEAPPAGLPSALPMVPAIAPELLSRHPGAAAVFDNLHLLQSVLLDLGSGGTVHDDPAAITAIVRNFTDLQSAVVDRYDWIRAALRRGIYYQGGPALGTLARSERNQHTRHHDGRHLVFPGMPAACPGC